MPLNVLIVGGGGREHALAWRLRRSPRVRNIYAAPGNPGTSEIGESIPIKPIEIDRLVRAARLRRIDLTIVGPEQPLAMGIVDAFQRHRLKIFGPTARAAQIEASKADAMMIAKKKGVLTPRFCIFDNYHKAMRYIRREPFPHVIKKNGLSRGRGVSVCTFLDQAEDALHRAMQLPNDAGRRVVIQEYIPGMELSAHILCDGESTIPFPPSQDYKRLFSSSDSPLTGGMGAYTPVLWATSSLMARVEMEIVNPILQGLIEEGKQFTGLLYPGLMIQHGNPYLLECNARFGDPETQVYMRLLSEDLDLLEVFEACIDRRLSTVSLKWNPGAAVCVVLASAGYPEAPQDGAVIEGIERAQRIPGVVIFHAGTVWDGNALRVAGGRVLNVTATGNTLREARERVYTAVDEIRFEGMQYRTDIATR